MNRSITFAALTLLAAAGVCRADEATEADLKAMQGEWKVVQIQTKGRTLGKDHAEIKDLRFIIKDNELRIPAPEDNSKARLKTFTLNPSTTPKSVDMLSKDGFEKDKTAAGIYKVDGDKLIFAIPDGVNNMADRPARFEATADNAVIVIELERIKAK